METTSNQKKMAIVAGILAVTMSITAVFIFQTASAQTTSNQTSSTTSQIPQLNGSVSISNATNQFVKDNVKVPFNTAAQTALGQVNNGVLISGRLSSVQGYLSYVFKVANYDAGTYKVVIVDAGNGKVLYTSDDLTLMNGGLGGGGCWHNGGSGYVNWAGKSTTSGSSQTGSTVKTSST